MVDDITERKQAEEEVRRERDRAQTYLDVAGVMMVALDAEGQVILLNHKGCEILGCSAQEAVGKNWVDNFIPPATRDEVKAIFQSIMEGKLEHVEYHENPVLTSRGEERVMAWQNTPLKDAEGRITGMLSSGNDITERKRMQQTLEESEKRFKDIATSSADWIWEVDKDGKYTFASGRVAQILGYTPEELIGKTPFELMPKDEAERVAEIFRQVASEKKTMIDLENWNLTKNGERICLLTNGVPILDEKGDLLGYRGVDKDITERKQAEETLRVSQFTLDHASDEVALIGPDARLVYVNEKVCQSLGYSRSELLSMTVHDLDPDFPKAAWPAHWKEVKERGSFTFESIHRTKDGREYPVETAVNLLEFAGRELNCSVARDITERKRAEEALKGSEERYKELAESITDVFFAMDENLRYTYWNRASENLTGILAKDAIGKSLYELFPDTKGTRMEEVYLEAIRTGQPTNYINAYELSGKQFVFEISVYPTTQGITVFTKDITERKRMEEELGRYSTQLEQLVFERTKKLAESERRFRELADLLPQIVFEIDENGNLQFMNQAAFAATGCTEEDFRKGLNAFQMFALEGHDRAMRGIQRIMTGETIGGREFTLLRRDGTTFPVLVYTSPIMREGKTVGLRGIAIDVTDRKRAEEELRAAKERLDYVITSNPAVIFTGKPHSDYTDFDNTYMSGSVTALLGYGPRDFIDDPELWSKHVHPEDGPLVRAAMPRLFKDGHLNVEYRFMHRDGSYRWIHEEVKVVRDSAGNPLDVIGYWTDITERRKMEEELRAGRERLEYAVASNPAVIYSAKPRADQSDFLLTYLSDRVVTMLGFEPQEFVGHPEFWEHHVHPDDLRSVLAGMPRLWKEGVYAPEYRFLHKDGAYRWIREEAKVVRDADGKPAEVNGYWTDVTERRRLEEALVRSQRLATIGELAGMVGHDLRNPLTGIMGATYSLRKKERSKLSKEGKKMLDLIEEAIRRSDKIINDLQEYSTELRLEPLRTDAKSITKDALESMEIPRTIRVVNSTRSQPKIMLDTERMRRVFLNIIRNAVDAMPNGGTLTLASKQTKDNLQVSIKDTGEGMEPETVARIWNPLFTTRAMGMGMGLPITKRFVEAHGGCISVETKPGKGSIFTVTLPVKRDLEGKEVKKK